MSLEGPNTQRYAPPDLVLEILDFIKNPSVFTPVFKAEKVRQTIPKASKKLQNSTPAFTKNDLHEKSFFCNTVHAKTVILKFQTSKIESEVVKQITWKQD